jgi:5'-nucleotidase
MIKFSEYQTKILRTKYKCDLVIALSHMRIPNNKLLAQSVKDLDFILAGHDHVIFN